MNYSGQFKQASEIISDVIFLDSEGIFLIDLTARDYITLKASPLVRKIIKPNGNYYELLGKLLGMFEGGMPEQQENNLLEAIVGASREEVATHDIPELQ